MLQPNLESATSLSSKSKSYALKTGHDKINHKQGLIKIF